jgi:molybdopterin converting factor small subunit
MTVKINLHKTHRQYTDGLEIIDANGTTVGACLNELVRRFPAMEKGLFDDNGKLRNNVEIYVNMESAYPDELAKSVKDGDEIHITLILTGG